MVIEQNPVLANKHIVVTSYWLMVVYYAKLHVENLAVIPKYVVECLFTIKYRFQKNSNTLDQLLGSLFCIASCSTAVNLYCTMAIMP